MTHNMLDKFITELKEKFVSTKIKVNDTTKTITNINIDKNLFDYSIFAQVTNQNESIKLTNAVSKKSIVRFTDDNVNIDKSTR